MTIRTPATKLRPTVNTQCTPTSLHSMWVQSTPSKHDLLLAVKLTKDGQASRNGRHTSECILCNSEMALSPTLPVNVSSGMCDRTIPKRSRNFCTAATRHPPSPVVLVAPIDVRPSFFLFFLFGALPTQQAWSFGSHSSWKWWHRLSRVSTHCPGGKSLRCFANKLSPAGWSAGKVGSKTAALLSNFKPSSCIAISSGSCVKEQWYKNGLR